MTTGFEARKDAWNQMLARKSLLHPQYDCDTIARQTAKLLDDARKMMDDMQTALAAKDAEIAILKQGGEEADKHNAAVILRQSAEVAELHACLRHHLSQRVVVSSGEAVITDGISNMQVTADYTDLSNPTILKQQAKIAELRGLLGEAESYITEICTAGGKYGYFEGRVVSDAHKLSSKLTAALAEKGE